MGSPPPAPGRSEADGPADEDEMDAVGQLVVDLEDLPDGAGAGDSMYDSYFTVNPAFTGRVTPVTYLASSEARNRTASEMSAGSTHGIGSALRALQASANCSRVGFSTPAERAGTWARSGSCRCSRWWGTVLTRMNCA